MPTPQITVRVPAPLLNAARHASAESMVPLSRRVRRDLWLLVQGDPAARSFVEAAAEVEAQGTVLPTDAPYSLTVSDSLRDDLRAAIGDTSFSTVVRASMSRLVSEHGLDWRALLVEP